mgnify:CR=1 FL=1
MASDAFFPFADGVDEAAAAGVTAIIQPGGSLPDAGVIAAPRAKGPAGGVTGAGRFRPGAPRAPRREPRESISRDVPAPVSLVSTLRPLPGSISSSATIARLRTLRYVIMDGISVAQALL